MNGLLQETLAMTYKELYRLKLIAQCLQKQMPQDLEGFDDSAIIEADYKFKLKDLGLWGQVSRRPLFSELQSSGYLPLHCYHI